MTLPENTNYEAFAEFLKSECMHETVYTDSEGRRILVIGLLDAFTMAHCWGARMVREERERCAKIAEDTVCDTHLPTGVKIYGTRAAKAIRGKV
jgi:hypothetical protein